MASGTNQEWGTDTIVKVIGQYTTILAHVRSWKAFLCHFIVPKMSWARCDGIQFGKKSANKNRKRTGEPAKKLKPENVSFKIS